MRSFYQDRLGTNIGKTQKSDCFLTGNDAVGYFLFAELCAAAAAASSQTQAAQETAHPVSAAGARDNDRATQEHIRTDARRALEVMVYDFCPGWGDIVRRVAAALPAALHDIVSPLGGSPPPPPPASVQSSANKISAAAAVAASSRELKFAVCDLQLAPSSPTNAAVMRGANDVDLTICCFCCHESGAATVQPQSGTFQNHRVTHLPSDFSFRSFRACLGNSPSMDRPLSNNHSHTHRRNGRRFFLRQRISCGSS
jgi:hypothetical protein